MPKCTVESVLMGRVGRRRGSSVRHQAHTLLAQRVYGLCCGWEDLNDHTTLRRDLAMQTAVGQVRELASAPTLSRFENAVNRADTGRLQTVLIEQFIKHWRGSAPDELVLDIDATHVPLHGTQERAAFNRYYNNYCYLPVYVFCGQTIRTRLLKIGAVILRNTRRVRLLLASNHPLKAVFLSAAQRLGP